MNGNISKKRCHLRFIYVVFQCLQLTGTTFFRSRLWNESTVACVTHQHSSTAFPKTVKVSVAYQGLWGSRHGQWADVDQSSSRNDGKQYNHYYLSILLSSVFFSSQQFLTLCCRILTLRCRCNWRIRNLCLSNNRTGTSCWCWIQRRRFSCLRWSCLRIFQSGCVPKIYPKTQLMNNFAALGYRKAQQSGAHEKLADSVKKRNGGRWTLRCPKAQRTGVRGTLLRIENWGMLGDSEQKLFH